MELWYVCTRGIRFVRESNDCIFDLRSSSLSLLSLLGVIMSKYLLMLDTSILLMSINGQNSESSKFRRSFQ